MVAAPEKNFLDYFKQTFTVIIMGNLSILDFDEDLIAIPIVLGRRTEN